uniref:Uncharacterized protein n=1 Tax=Rhizophora mucronata TaxID=61149 RepID=A0A2P2LH10_RHIMU
MLFVRIGRDFTVLRYQFTSPTLENVADEEEEEDEKVEEKR